MFNQGLLLVLVPPTPRRFTMGNQALKMAWAFPPAQTPPFSHTLRHAVSSSNDPTVLPLPTSWSHIPVQATSTKTALTEVISSLECPLTFIPAHLALWVFYGHYFGSCYLFK